MQKSKAANIQKIAALNLNEKNQNPNRTVLSPPPLFSPYSYICPLQHAQSKITTWHDKHFFAVILHAPKIINKDF